MDRWTVILILGQFVFLGFIIWVVARGREARLRQRSEERSRLVERFSSSQELTDFLNSPAGAKFLDVARAEPAHPARSISGTVTAGIIVLFAGIGFLFLSGEFPGRANDSFLIPGILGVMAGSGILISAFVSTVLYKRAGLLPRKPEAHREEP
ncbi:MAG: hypothetical protein ACJ76J_14405 [Thermoanaerobaculia bacterium]